MTSLQRLIVGLGVLDLAYVTWTAIGLLGSSGFAKQWQGVIAFGLPYPALQAAVVLGIYVAILICGLGLLLRRPSFAWLNYALFPFRVILALPTFFPVFAALLAAGLVVHPGVVFALLAATELLRVIVVRIWSRRVLAAGRFAGAAA